MHWHQLRSQIPLVFQVTSHTVGLFALYFVSSIQFVAVPLYSISDLYANSLSSFTLRKRSCEVLSLQSQDSYAARSAAASWMWALKILHEKNWRVSLRVQELFHPQDFL